MGGNALKHVGVERKNKAEYNEILCRVEEGLHEALPGVRFAPIEAYADKESFGDADILLESDSLPESWQERVRLKFNPTDWFNNEVVQSFDTEKLQVDLILVPKESFEFAKRYFDFNDLGNLMGRIAHKMGFKYGHLGLFAPLRDGETSHQYAEIAVTMDSAAAMKFMGYDPLRYDRGFKNLEEIFEFVISSEFTHREIFLLDNRNAKSRVRDAKRPTYTAFLKWLEAHPEADKYKWPESEDLAQKSLVKRGWFMKAKEEFPQFKKQVEDANKTMENRKLLRQKWNGTLVSEWTGVSGARLKSLMATCKESRKDFVEWALQASSDDLANYARKFRDGSDVYKTGIKV